MSRKPLEYATLLEILRPLPKEDSDYVLAFLLAAEQRDAKRRAVFNAEDKELRLFRNELRDKYATKEREAAEAARLGRTKTVELYNRFLKLTSKDSLCRLTPETEGLVAEALRELNRILKKEVDAVVG